ncbi:MAG: putative restriction endonuclease [Thermomicrobiales bacterium]|nr:putative restriction endonuclease [Thermomicrobiales bacterium]
MVARARTVDDFMLEEPDRIWEVHRGKLREKPSTSESHNRVIWRLVEQFVPQLDRNRFELRLNMGRVRRTEETYDVPDLYVIPVTGPVSIRDLPYRLEVFDQPLPLVVEGWSPSTGGYDVNEKLPEYMERGDLEIWQLSSLPPNPENMAPPIQRHLRRDHPPLRQDRAGRAARRHRRPRRPLRLIEPPHVESALHRW